MSSAIHHTIGRRAAWKTAVKRLIWAGVPLISLGAASWASAYDLKAALSVNDPSIPTGSEVFRCALIGGGIGLPTPFPDAHMQAKARALDACGNPTYFAGSTPATITSSRVGTTASLGNVQNSIGPCGAPTQHRVWLQAHRFRFGVEEYQDWAVGAPSVCWTSNTQTGACTSDTGYVTISSSRTSDGTVCANRGFRAVSIGAP